MNEPLFENFFLVGGTALALQIGHRNSIDIDMFGSCEINKNLFIEKLKEYGNVTVTTSTKNILILNTNGIKIDFVHYNYPILETPIEIDGIRILCKADTAAMKLNAIAGRGSKKDFIDLYFLLKEFSLREMMDFYNRKYTDGSEFMVCKSLSFFEDADTELDVKMYQNFNWETCKQEIIKELISLSSD